MNTKLQKIRKEAIEFYRYRRDIAIRDARKKREKKYYYDGDILYRDSYYTCREDFCSIDLCINKKNAFEYLISLIEKSYKKKFNRRKKLDSVIMITLLNKLIKKGYRMEGDFEDFFKETIYYYKNIYLRKFDSYSGVITDQDRYPYVTYIHIGDKQFSFHRKSFSEKTKFASCEWNKKRFTGSQIAFNKMIAA